MEYNPTELESKWRKIWQDQQQYRVLENPNLPKYYVLDMFPYPSGAGLHVGHPLGYIASDIYSRYKTLEKFNVLHPMGFDSFGLPAEQYAIQTGLHPAITTESNIQRYREQLDLLGFSYDWSRELRTSSSDYYKWTQWIFIQLFHSWFNPKKQKAEKIETLIEILQREGYTDSNFPLTGNEEPKISSFSAQDWNSFSEERKQGFLMNFRLAYLDDTWVNWCSALGTVLANDEVINGLSERGGHPVERKKMKQWSLRITSYADRLLEGLETIDWSDSIKDMQRNWIGKSKGALIYFQTENQKYKIQVFTTRPDTIFGVSYITLAPEHEWVLDLTTEDQLPQVREYIIYAKNRSERERQADVKTISGVFTGSYAIHPFTSQLIPIWIGDYVLSGYGTGAVMAVPAHDERDFRFAKQFHLPIRVVVEPSKEWNFEEAAYTEKNGVLLNSEFLNQLDVKDAIYHSIQKLEALDKGKGKTNYRLRDAIFGRQRYWGEPIPVYYKNGLAYTLNEDELPLNLPEVDKYLPTEDGEPPLARAQEWKYQGEFEYEKTTMPGWAGSSWYFLRYMDPHNKNEFVSKEKMRYWNQVDLYIGGSEHATGHLLYARFWTKFLFDLGHIIFDEPFKKMINQGMILGKSAIAFVSPDQKMYSADLIDLKDPQFRQTRILVDLIQDDESINLEELIKWQPHFAEMQFIKNQEGKIIVHREVDKMSKRWFNVVNPDDLCKKYGADTLRMYEMFLGPLEQSKPWDTKGITGVSKFLRKFWSLFYNSEGVFVVTTEEPGPKELKALHLTIKNLRLGLENFSFNTCVSDFMKLCNELKELNCHKKEILQDFLILLAPFAPHISEELWQALGHKNSIFTEAQFPTYKESFLIDNEIEYPICINGKKRTSLVFLQDSKEEEIKNIVLGNTEVQKWLEGKPLQKIVIVPKKMVNLVV